MLKDLESINELIALEDCEEDVRQLKKRKMYLMAALTALQLGIEKDIAKSIIDPITLDTIIEDAVISPYGHSFDRKTITRWLEENNICPITQKNLELKQLIPDPDLQRVIDDLSPKLAQLKVDTDSIDTKL